ncbi:uncharacterized protein LOC143033010 [Oratosquilla oratoria]|uniref:uncharacterized protein LOC143033010 n=1 Tax=Oratosquilla oratoria TaxID=337810 RepID=UPI003F76908F
MESHGGRVIAVFVIITHLIGTHETKPADLQSLPRGYLPPATPGPVDSSSFKEEPSTSADLVPVSLPDPITSDTRNRGQPNLQVPSDFEDFSIPIPSDIIRSPYTNLDTCTSKGDCYFLDENEECRQDAFCFTSRK